MSAAGIPQLLGANPGSNNECCFSSALGNSPLEPNPVSVGTVSKQLCQKNLIRKEIIVLNVGTTTIYLNLASPATGTQYTIPLSPCAAAHDGTGGVYISDIWQGEIHAISSAAGGLVNITELG